MSSIKKIFSYRNYLPVYLLIILLVNIFFINIPLIRVFGYEFSVANSVLLTFISGLYVISLLKNEEKNNFVNKLILPSFLFLLVPFLVSFINSLLTGFCSFIDGLLFYIVITVPSIIIGFTCGLVSSFFLKRFRRILFFLLIIIILVITLGEFYFNPQIYFYNSILGYLPGTIYDEALTVDLKLVVYRFLNLIFFGGLFAGLILNLSEKIQINKLFVFLYIIIIPAVFIFLSPSFGYSTTFTKLKSELSNSVSTEHFDIFFDKGISDDFVKLLALHHEYFYTELVDYLKVKPKEKIQSFIFKDRQQKKELFGSANADVAKTWMYSIFTTYDNYNSSLKHEIAHCFSTEFGEGPLKIADMINPFLIEGIASACDPFTDENEVDYLASIAYQNGYKINLAQMYKFASFFTQPSTLSYIYAGSFTKYLIKNYGIEKFKKLYVDPDFPEIYGKSVNELEKEYFAYLDEFETDNKTDKANYYFGRKSIFYKVCPRFISDRLGKAWEHYQKREFKEAKELFEFILEKGETYSAVVGLSSCLEELNKKVEAISVIKKHLNNFENTGYYYNLEYNLADLYAKNGKTGIADSLYKKLLEQNPNSTIYYLADMRSELCKKDNLIKDYLSGEDSIKYSILKKINDRAYLYSSIPVMINLSKFLEEDYSDFISQFDKTLFVKDYLSAYSIYLLSVYMTENLDFSKARRMAALSLRYKDDYNLYAVLNDNYKKINWLYLNSEKVLTTITNKNNK